MQQEQIRCRQYVYSYVFKGTTVKQQQHIFISWQSLQTHTQGSQLDTLKSMTKKILWASLVTFPALNSSRSYFQTTLMSWSRWKKQAVTCLINTAAERRQDGDLGIHIKTREMTNTNIGFSICGNMYLGQIRSAPQWSIESPNTSKHSVLGQVLHYQYLSLKSSRLHCVGGGIPCLWKKERQTT